MEDYVLWNDLGKERYQDLLREAEQVRRVLRSKKVSKLPPTLKSLVVFLISVV